MRIIALWIGKLVYVILRLFGRRGAALPGLIIERLSPGFMAKSLDLLPDGVIIITGTNGKTTSTKMLAHVLGINKKVLTNSTGSNFVRGIIASIIQYSKWSGVLPFDIAVIELDEAYAAQFVKLYKPRITVVLNVMRDQMDRFGEIDNTAMLISKVVAKTTDFVVLNRDDYRVAKMAARTSRPVYYFGVDSRLRDIYRNDDELHQTSVNNDTKLSAIVELLDIRPDSNLNIKIDGQQIDMQLAAKGTYNAQNALAVLATAYLLDNSVEKITTKLTEVKAAFGRGEIINIGKKSVILQLVKNPGGFRHALLSGFQANHDIAVIAINDDYADGRDVSWLWDVNFRDRLPKIISTTGTRAADMALRLKYDQIKIELIESNLSKCLNTSLEATRNDGSIIIYSTYTAMLEIRNLLSKITEVEKV